MWRAQEVWACSLKYDNIAMRADIRYYYCRGSSVHDIAFQKKKSREICWPEQEREIKEDGKRFCLFDDLTWTEGNVCTSSLGQGKLCGFVHSFVWVIQRVSKNQSQTTRPQLKKPVSSALVISELYEFWPTTLSSYNKPPQQALSRWRTPCPSNHSKGLADMSALAQ